MTTINGATLRIILDAPTGGVLDVNVQRDLYSIWKEWVKMSDNSKFPLAFRTVGGDNLTPGVEAGAYFFLQNQNGWRIISSDDDQTINYNGNLVGESSTTPLIVATPGRTVLHLGLQPVTQRVDEILTQSQIAAYNGKVAINLSSSNSGTVFPIGTLSAPVNNMTDAYTLASNIGTKEFVFRGSITLDRDTTDWTFTGLSSEKNDLINLAGYDVNRSRFIGARLTGAMIGNIEAEQCDLEVVLGLNGLFRRCGLSGGIALASASECIFANCYSEVPGTGTPSIDINGATSVLVRNYSGGLRLTNLTSATMASVDLDPGTIKILDGDGNVGGTVQISGLGWKELGSSIGTTIIDKLFDVQEAQVALASLVGNADVSLDDLTVNILDKNLASLRQLSVSADGRTRRIL